MKKNSISASTPSTELNHDHCCYHCGLPVPVNSDYRVEILGESRLMCCQGCEAVANAIVSSSLEDFYRYRTDHAPQGEELIPDRLREAQVYDNPQIQKSFVSQGEGSVKAAALILEGITCAACIWLNERHLASIPGVKQVQINYATHRAQICWDDERIQLSAILEAVSQIGYKAHPYDPGRQHELLEKERKEQIRRLGLTGALGMQVMIVAVALYFGNSTGMATEYRSFFHWVSLILTLPVIGFAALPFFRSAWRDLRLGRVGMDVPISLGILGAFSASVWNTLNQQGHVYYDSAVMFVFFLLAARFFELTGRRRANDATEHLVHLSPTVATRLVNDSVSLQEEVVPVAELAPGDLVLVKPGERVPTDGMIVTGRSTVDESLLTGESLPIARSINDNVIGGSINIESPLQVRVAKLGQDTALSQVLNLLERALAEKPRITQLADQAASWFVLGVLVLAVSVSIYWWHTAPSHWFEITIAVLVVTCPCALSLATPTAITAGTNTLTRLGLLVTRGNTLETLARATHVAFDKTGTLTQGKLQLLHVHALSERSVDRALVIAASIERHSEHPVANALVSATNKSALPTTNVRNTPGRGIKARVENNEYWLGSLEFISQSTRIKLNEVTTPEFTPGNTMVFLANRKALLAAFELGDEIRPDAKELIATLHHLGLDVLLLSGDQPVTTRQVAQRLGITPDRVYGALTPNDKLARVRALQKQGAVVAMVGDGVNDAPVLAGAQVSIAIGGGAQLAAATGDMIMLSDKLLNLSHAFMIARATRRIIRQNIIWAITYNVVALPAAAMGFVQPWMAAIGMSASSFLVVANALRLSTRKHLD